MYALGIIRCRAAPHHVQQRPTVILTSRSCAADQYLKILRQCLAERICTSNHCLHMLPGHHSRLPSKGIMQS